MSANKAALQRGMPRWLRRVLVVAAPIAIGVMLGLGFWQLRRLDERRAVNAAILARRELPVVDLNTETDLDPAALEYRRTVVRGTFDPAGEVYWRNQEYDGAPGMHVVTPLVLEGGGAGAAVLVDRGWLPLTGPTEVDGGRFPPPTGLIDVQGLIRNPPRRTSSFSPYDPVPEPGGAPLKAWFWLDPSLIAGQLATPLLPVVVIADPTAPDAWPRADTTVVLDEGSHLGYAIQWFSFAAITTVGLIAYWRTTRRR